MLFLRWSWTFVFFSGALVALLGAFALRKVAPSFLKLGRAVVGRARLMRRGAPRFTDERWRSGRVGREKA